MRKKRKYLSELDKLVDQSASGGLIFRDPENLKKQKGKWSKLFGNKFPIILEIGMGTGSFLKQLIAYETENRIEHNYLGLEVKGVRVIKAYKKNKELAESGLLKFIETKAQFIGDYFGKGEIDTIYLNFSDPWPKAKHHLNRLTAPKYLEIYKTILKSDGELVMKTDNEELFNYSIESLTVAGFAITEKSEDLHNSDFALKQFVTEFESRFLAKGMPIFYLKAEK